MAATPTTIGVDGPSHENHSGLVRAASHSIRTFHRSGNNSSIIPGFGHGPVIVKPIALKAKEGFGILTGRSKSTPPIPREQVGKQPPSYPGVPPQTGDYNTGGSTALPIDVANKKANMPYLDLPVPPMNQMSISTPDPQPPSSQLQTPIHHSPTPQTSTPSPHPAVSVPPQNNPSTSLEAYFLERKRRGVSGGGVIPRIVTPTPGVKGKGFKSSPLTPTEKEATDGVKNKGTSSEARGDGSNFEK